MIIKFETNLKIYIEATRYSLQIYIQKKLMYDTNSSLEHTIGQKNHTPKSANKFTWSDNAKNNEALFP